MLLDPTRSKGAQQHMMLRSMAFLLLVAASYQQYPALFNTKGKMLDSYGPIVNECKNYMGGTIVMSRILDGVKSGQWNAAKKIYTSENLKTDPASPLQYYASARNGNFDTTSQAAQKFWSKGRAYYGSITYVDNYFSAFKDAAKVEAGLVWTSLLWMMNQVDNSRYFMTDAGRAKHKLTAGPAEMDDTACLYISFKNKVFSLWKFYGTVDKNYGAGKCPSTNKRVVGILNTLHNQARDVVTPQKNFTGFDGAYNNLLETICVGQLRAVMWQAGKLTKQSTTFAHGYLLPCAPLLKDKASADSLRALLSNGKIPSVTQVKTLVQALAKRGTREKDISGSVFCA